jgi:hypothetical protein
LLRPTHLPTSAARRLASYPSIVRIDPASWITLQDGSQKSKGNKNFMKYMAINFYKIYLQILNSKKYHKNTFYDELHVGHQEVRVSAVDLRCERKNGGGTLRCQITLTEVEPTRLGQHHPQICSGWTFAHRSFKHLLVAVKIVDKW